MSEPSYVAVATCEEVPPGTVKAVEAGGLQLLICHAGGEWFAIENRCSHAEEPLTCGRIRLGWIACPAHGARFDLASGEALGPPATQPIRTFGLRIADGRIEVAVPV